MYCMYCVRDFQQGLEKEERIEKIIRKNEGDGGRERERAREKKREN